MSQGLRLLAAYGLPIVDRADRWNSSQPSCMCSPEASTEEHYPDKASFELHWTAPHAQAHLQMDEASGRRGKRQARQDVEKAEERVRKYDERLAAIGAAPLPSVEIGSLEEIIASMEADQSGTWSSVMFVPPGVMGDGIVSAKQPNS